MIISCDLLILKIELNTWLMKIFERVLRDPGCRMRFSCLFMLWFCHLPSECWLLLFSKNIYEPTVWFSFLRLYFAEDCMCFASCFSHWRVRISFLIVCFTTAVIFKENGSRLVGISNFLLLVLPGLIMSFTVMTFLHLGSCQNYDAVISLRGIGIDLFYYLF